MTPAIPILWPSNSIPSARIWREVERWRDPRCRIPAPLHLSSPATGQKCHSFTLGFKSDTVLFCLSKVTQFSPQPRLPQPTMNLIVALSIFWTLTLCGVDSQVSSSFYQVEFLSVISFGDIIFKIQI